MPLSPHLYGELYLSSDGRQPAQDIWHLEFTVIKYLLSCMQIHISDEIALNRAENIAQSAVLLALPFLMPECQLLHLVSCCFYRTHQVLVDLKGCELQGQLHSLSVRVREWGICRSSQGYGQWVLHRLSGVVVWGELNG